MQLAGLTYLKENICWLSLSVIGSHHVTEGETQDKSGGEKMLVPYNHKQAFTA